MGRKWLDNYGQEENYNDSKISIPPGFAGQGYDISGRNYSPAWEGQFETGGSLQENSNITNPIDISIFPIKKIAQNRKIIKDNNGYWNPNNWGKVVEISSNDITMKGVNQPLLGISDEGDIQYMEPNKDYKFKGKRVREFPISQDGGKYGILGSPEEQRDWLINYIQSPMYKERLSIELRNSKESVDDMISKRLNNVKNTQIFYPSKPIGNNYGYISGLSVMDKVDSRRKYLDNNGNITNYKKDNKFKKQGIYLEPEFNPQNKIPITNGFETVPVHEIGHQLDENGTLIPNDTIVNIANRTNANLSVPQIKKSIEKGQFEKNGIQINNLRHVYNSVTKGKNDEKGDVVFDYYTTPTEFNSRLLSIRMLLDKTNIHKPGIQKFNSEMYDKMIQNKIINNNSNFQDVIKSIKGKDSLEKKKNFIHLMNTIASNQDNKDFVPIAKNGINDLDENSLQQLDQLINFTNYNKLSNGGWLDKF